MAKATTLAPDTVLRALAAACVGNELPERPVVRLRLTSGHVEEGWLIGVGSDRTDEVVVLGSPPHRHQMPEEAVYLRMRDVVSVGVYGAERFRDVLSGGVLPLPVSGEPVTRLVLRREFSSSAVLPLRIDWAALPDTPVANTALAGLLAALRLAVSDLRGDEAGRQAWAGITTVCLEHRPGEDLALLRTAEDLTVSADLTAALPRRLDAEVRRQLNTVL